MYNSMLSSSNSLDFNTPINQYQNNLSGGMGSGNQQSLNMSYNIPINTGPPLPPPYVPQQPQPQPQQPQQPQGWPGSQPPAGGGYPPGIAPGEPYPPSYPCYPPPMCYPPMQPPICYPPMQPPVAYCPPPPPVIIEQPPVIVRPAQPSFNQFENIINVLINSINQNRQCQRQDQDTGAMPLFFLLFVMLGAKRPAPPPPPPAPAPPAPAPTPDDQQKATDISHKGSPLTLDLNGDGVKTSDTKTAFDITGNGQQNMINDISSGDAVLTLDSDGDGVSGEDGSELLGNHTDLSRFGIQGTFNDGFDALKALVNNAVDRGLIAASHKDHLDAQDLQKLQQTYGLKVKVGGLNSQNESLTDAGVTGLNLGDGEKSVARNFDGNGNDLLSQQGASFVKQDGSTGGYSDIFFQY